MSGIFDLAIIGGGPAGTSAAITAARNGMRVLVLDKDTFPRPKVCGEFVSSESLDLLTNLLGEKHTLLTDTQTISRGRLFIGSSVIHTHIAPCARSIPRFELDEALWRAAMQAGVDTHAGEAVYKVTGTGPFFIETAKATHASRALINASGRWSGVLQTPEPVKGPKWIGVKAHYTSHAAPSLTSVDLYFFKYGYCGVQPVRPGVVNVCAMVRSDVATSIEEVLRSHRALMQASGSWQRATDTVFTAPLLHKTPTPSIGNVLHVGDAAGFIDPFLGDGISLALQTGSRAASALLPFLRGRKTLHEADTAYVEGYRQDVVPAFHHATRLRLMLSVAQPFQPLVIGMLKIPHLTEWFLKMTRAKSAN